MKLYIFEGIATTGKSTLERLLEQELSGAVMISEMETLMGLIENRSPEIARDHLLALLRSFGERHAGALIIDRFHLTHAFRTGAPLSFFQDIERGLGAFQPLLVFLTLDPASIQGRIEEASRIRGDAWSKGKAGTIEEKTQYYTSQQHDLQGLFAKSTLPKLSIDTTEKRWDAYVEEIVSRELEGGKG